MPFDVRALERSQPKTKKSVTIALALALVLSGAEGALAEPDLLTRIPGLDALARVRVPPALGRLLEKAGIETHGGDTLISTVHPGYREPAPVDPASQALMDRARREDVVVDLSDPLFDPESIQQGMWHSDAFAKRYGTALFVASAFDDERIPLVLVHGINGSPRDFRTLVSRLEDSPYQPVLFFYPSGMPLTDAGAELSERLQAFTHRHAVSQFAIVAHSMGGLVVKGMLDQIDAEKSLPGLRLFVSMSSPWGGIKLAEHAGQIPRHPPCWDDLAATSPFIRRINSNPFPSDVPFYVFFGARGEGGFLSTGSGDGVLPLASSVDAPVTKSARDIFGFYEDHNSILASRLVYQRLSRVLAEEIPPRHFARVKANAATR